ncbi:MAG: NUDIX domain-containing protein [Clostridiales bacterium]|nr:NUDIX domain-containing protein [Clostridiales bacterium]
MLERNCAGGIVFFHDSVLLLQNEKAEWCFPKGVIRTVEKPEDVALERVSVEAGVKAKILFPVGRTNYEFYSITRQRPVCNKIVWYVMRSEDDKVTPNAEQNFSKGGFFPVEEALEMVTYSQDRSLLMMAYQRYKELV